MKKDPAFLFYPKDWLEGTAEYMPDEKGVYIDLLCHQHQKGSLPADTARLARMVGLQHEEFLRIWKAISPQFNRTEDRMVNRKLHQVMNERAEKGKLNTIIGTFASLLRKQKIAPEDYKALRSSFKPSDFTHLKKEEINNKLSEWLSDRLTDRCENGTQSIGNGNANANKDIDVIKKGGMGGNKKTDLDFIDQIVELFVQQHGDYIVVNRGKERASASKLLSIYKSKSPDSNSEKTLEDLGDYFHHCINIPDNWLRNNMSLAIIVSKFNEINNILRNGTNKGTGASDRELAAIVAKHYANG